MNKLDRLNLKQQNALARAITNLENFVKVSECNPEVETMAIRVRMELETLTDTYHDLYGAKQ